MQANQLTIQALENTAAKLEFYAKNNSVSHGAFTITKAYSWSSPLRCNCGLFIRELIKLEKPRYNDLAALDWLIIKLDNGLVEIGSYAIAAAENFQLNIFQYLKALGVQQQDYEDLEYLGKDRHTAEKYVANKDSNIPADFTQPAAVAAYMRKIANQLKTQLPTTFAHADNQ